MLTVYSFAVLFVMQTPNNDDLTKSFIKKVTPIWNNYLDLSRGIQGSFSSEMRDIASNKGTLTKWSIKKNNTAKLFQVETFKLTGTNSEFVESEVSVTNSLYRFKINKTLRKPEWRTIELDRVNKVSLEELNQSLGMLLLFGENLAFPDVFKKSNFTVNSLQETSENNGSYCIVDCSFVDDSFAIKCRIYLDNNNFMVVKKSSTKCYSNNDLVYYEDLTNEYVVNSGIPVPINRNWNRNMKYSGNSWARGTVCDKGLLNVATSLPNDSEFTLTAYGLPEPSWSAASSTVHVPWHMYIAAIGIMCIVLATIILHRRGKRVST